MELRAGESRHDVHGLKTKKGGARGGGVRIDAEGGGVFSTISATSPEISPRYCHRICHADCRLLCKTIIETRTRWQACASRPSAVVHAGVVFWVSQSRNVNPR